MSVIRDAPHLKGMNYKSNRFSQVSSCLQCKLDSGIKDEKCLIIF